MTTATTTLDAACLACPSSLLCTMGRLNCTVSIPLRSDDAGWRLDPNADSMLADTGHWILECTVPRKCPRAFVMHNSWRFTPFRGHPFDADSKEKGAW